MKKASLILIFMSIFNFIVGQKDSNDLKLSIGPYTAEPFIFGYKSLWIAVRSDSPALVANKLADLEKENYKTKKHIFFKYDNSEVYVSNVYKGWTFILADLRDMPSGEDLRFIPDLKALLNNLSTSFGEAQYFGSHRVVDYSCWVKSTNGKIDRFFSFVGGGDGYVLVEGEPSAIETKHNLLKTTINLTDADYEKFKSPDEEILMDIAGNWSIDPVKLSDEEFNDLWKNAICIRIGK
jgi:hypothetical protein